MTGDLAAQALAYARAGWPVFPTRPNADPCPYPPDECECKAPLTAHGFHDASTDPAQIRAWWRRWPGANVAIATGAPGPDVLDLDVKPEGDGWAAYGRLKLAGLLAGALAIVTTPSGGQHVHYAGTAQPSARLPRHWLDFKARGGYVLAPPSVVHGRPYTLAGHRHASGTLDWQAVRALLAPPPPMPPRPADSDHDVTKLAAWVATLPEGNRNAGLYWAACRINGDRAAADALIAAAIIAGLSEQEARRTVTSATGRDHR
jgi:hypothetical protein